MWLNWYQFYFGSLCMRGITSHKTLWILSLLNENNCWYATIAVWFYFGERKIINIPIVSMLGKFITAILQVRT